MCTEGCSATKGYKRIYTGKGGWSQNTVGFRVSLGFGELLTRHLIQTGMCGHALYAGLTVFIYIYLYVHTAIESCLIIYEHRRV